MNKRNELIHTLLDSSTVSFVADDKKALVNLHTVFLELYSWGLFSKKDLGFALGQLTKYTNRVKARAVITTLPQILRIK